MLPIHVINLTREPERLGQMARQLDGFGLQWRRVEAIDRLAVSEADLRRSFGGSRDFPATAGDMACSLTHQRLWLTVAREGGAAVILEDDAQLSAGFAGLVATDLAGLMERHGMGALKLEYWPGPQQSRRYPLGQPLGQVPGGGGAELYRLRSSFLGTCGYVLTADAAARLIARFPKLDVPVDHFLFGRAAGRGFSTLRPGFLNPAPVLHDAPRFGSDISGSRVGEEGPRTFGRRIVDAALRLRQAGERRRGMAEPVGMRFADGDAT